MERTFGRVIQINVAIFMTVQIRNFRKKIGFSLVFSRYCSMEYCLTGDDSTRKQDSLAQKLNF